MSDEPSQKPAKSGPTFAEQIGAKANRKLRARHGAHGVWFGLGMMGLIGWSVAIPTLLGAALGHWLDTRHAGRHRGRWRSWWRGWSSAASMRGTGSRRKTKRWPRATMSEALVLTGMAGVGLGAIFFGGLWWTVRKGVSANQPALWFFASWLLADGDCPLRVLRRRRGSCESAARLSRRIRPFTTGCDVADATIGRYPTPIGAGGWPCTLARIR